MMLVWKPTTSTICPSLLKKPLKPTISLLDERGACDTWFFFCFWTCTNLSNRRSMAPEGTRYASWNSEWVWAKGQLMQENCACVDMAENGIGMMLEASTKRKLFMKKDMLNMCQLFLKPPRTSEILARA